MASIRQEIISSRVTLTPQCYGGDMTEWDSAGTFKDLVDYGFPYQRIDLFYDAQKLRRGWHGYAFTQDRLP